jgi:hypothetical protein
MGEREQTLVGKRPRAGGLLCALGAGIRRWTDALT